MDFKFYDSLARKNEIFEHGKSEKIKLYTCGPTVYNLVHLGNLRAYIFPDILKRALEFNGYGVDWVMNITDVDDKTIANTIKKYGAGAGTQELSRFTQEYFERFLSDLSRINIDAAQIRFVKVSEKIPKIQEFILRLMEKGYAYKAEDNSTYFSIEKYQNDFGDYGALVGGKFLEGKKIGARVKVDEYDKDDLSDFALWKARDKSDGGIFWDHPILGQGRPGWHIECTVINHDAFGSGTDIHTGGIDLLFPHHTNEIAQAQPIYKPFVNYWMHSEHILVENKKMSKSLGNFLILDELEKAGELEGLQFRFLVLQSHYRSQMNITKQSMEAAKNGFVKLQDQAAELKIQAHGDSGKIIQGAYEKFEQAINNDLNTAEALAITYELLGASEKPENKFATLLEFDKVLGLELGNAALQKEFISANKLSREIKEILRRRNNARKNKDFATSDKLRQEIESKGYEILDTPEGTKLRKI